MPIGKATASPAIVGVTEADSLRDGQVVDRIGWFIQPPFGHDHFVDWNVRIHGITPDMVVGAPSWTEQLVDLMAFTEHGVNYRIRYYIADHDFGRLGLHHPR